MMKKIWLILCVCGVFCLGIVTGCVILNKKIFDSRSYNRTLKYMHFTKDQCGIIQDKIIDNIKNCHSSICNDKLKEMHAIYHDDCVGREFELVAPRVKMRSCEVMQDIIEKQFNMYPGNLSKEKSGFYRDHIDLASYFVKLAIKGCPENAGKYRALAMREIEIVESLTVIEYIDMNDKQEINRILKLLGNAE